MNDALLREITQLVTLALNEDVGDSDITAALIPEHVHTEATIITREKAVLCGQAWVNKVFKQVDRHIQIEWLADDGDNVHPDQALCRLSGKSRSLLTAERCALNFLQTLSGTATISARYAQRVSHTPVRILDTRKTLPGWRLSQKYAVRCGGCQNHRIGLFDAYLIKENHIAACGSIEQAVWQAKRNSPGKPVEVEVENSDELRQALAAGTDRIMLDNFNLEDMHKAVKINAGQAKLEVSGNVNETTLVAIAETGVDYISIGALTKHIRAIDLSMRLANT